MALGFYNHDTNTTGAGGYSSLFRPPSPELPPELFSFNETSTLYDNNCINQLFEPNYSDHNNLGFPTNYSDVLPPPTATVTTTGHVITPSPEFQVSTFAYDQDPYFHHLPYSTTFHNHPHFFMLEHPPQLPPLPEFYYHHGGGGGGGGTLMTSSSWYDSGINGEDRLEESGGSSGVIQQMIGKGNSGGGMIRLSAQSMAARVRRRKISEKSQELGKLIPGGHKMNTAEMFQAAYKYIKFLQAQVAVFKLMASIPEGEEVMDNGELMEALVTCSLMQEKLYTAEKCIVSKHFAETLAIN